jgi:hypothetical protein
MMQSRGSDSELRSMTVTLPGQTPLEAVPNVSEGRDEEAIAAIGRVLAGQGCRLLDVHSDPYYGRSVFTLVGEPQALADAVVVGAREIIERLDIHRHRGAHPCIGALDVVPVVYLRLPWSGHGFDALGGGVGGQIALATTERFIGAVLTRGSGERR